MSIYVIADLHLSFSADKSMDVFDGWQNYTQRLQENWTRLVKPEDTVVLAGDISWAMKLEEAVADFSYIHALPGKKLILKGNHDYWWSTKSKIDHFLADNGFADIQIIHNNAYEIDGMVLCGTRGWLYQAKSPDDIKIVNREAGRLLLSLEAGKHLTGKRVVFLHYPPVYDHMECQEILEILLAHGISDCYFGHIHGTHAAKKAPVGDYKGIRMHLCSCDYVKFMPVLVR